MNHNKSNKGVFNVTVTAQKWGNSIGVRIPQKLAKKYGVENGTQIQMIDDGEGIKLKPVKNEYTLEELLAKCKPENRHEEIDFGGPVGRELI